MKRHEKMFTAIRASDLEIVRQIIEKKPELVNCVAKQILPSYNYAEPREGTDGTLINHITTMIRKNVFPVMELHSILEQIRRSLP